MKIAINGFGRIGKLVFRALVEKKLPKVEVVAINELGSLESNIHLMKFDSVHGRLPFDIKKLRNGIKYKNKFINFYSERKPENLPWKKLKIDIVLECSGFFTSKESANLHLQAGAKKVIISAPGKNVDTTIVQGVNNKTLEKKHNIISNGSCTTNCLAPVAMILDKEIGIDSGFMTTIHSYTGDQRTVDQNHSDMRRARGAAISMIPTSTGAAKALSLVLPNLKGKLDGTAIRVPTPNVSLIDLTFVSRKKTSTEKINDIMLRASKSSNLKNILTTNNLPLVSIDFNHNPSSSIFDITQTQVLNNKFCRVLAWYDNEWGFSNRMVETMMDLKKFI
ncbi:MAG: Glyceraldehyde-3-phosphate dehydrogenase [Alphaproteobacteria bacterium MarineAlpha5_Bin5]|mgnify:CR=1 FL=1|nr:MAG: Glyceraldehyde-3-phosphate dehydrogenase [Alphaproteobacteria bacterium MarineAlpha5_Bin5]PPR52595.1 MAG: Glyceraldehyde-3-phosphate dehydrogenase [Alphaproteobacteria bacterium MarineAlpha5_Bin4]|tara:strand:- start:3966 stop:4970 length:1005 start_codon:yes stop_codon:yes gene_type:complete